MKKKEALQALINGHRITHPDWSDNMYIRMDDDGDIIDELGELFYLDSFQCDGHLIKLPKDCPKCGGDGECTYICSFCNGSGEGKIDGFTCKLCKGLGMVTDLCEECND